jgi:ribosome-associated translation inhibitor RaiA
MHGEDRARRGSHDRLGDAAEQHPANAAAAVRAISDKSVATRIVRRGFMPGVIASGVPPARRALMAIPLDITFRAMDSSPAASAAIREWVDRLERCYDRIERCEVIVEKPHRSQRHGNPFEVHVHLAVPEHAIDISRGGDPAHADVYLAINDAFRAARRRLLDRIEARR